MTSISHRYLAAAAGAVLLGLCQSASAQAQPPKADCALPATSDPTLPPLTAICGLDGPEDIAPLPDQRHLVISNLTFSGTAPKSAELHLLDTATDTVSTLRRSYAPGPMWGDPQCVAAQGFSSHGIDIRRRADGKQQLLVVNHAEREAIDFFELTEDNAGPLAAWRGCVTGAGKGHFNDVSADARGGFVASIMYEVGPSGDPVIQQPGDTNSGYLVQWTPDMPRIERLAGSDAPFVNGVQISRDGRQVYLAAWKSGELRTYDLASKTMTVSVTLAFHPDNLTMADDGSLFTAGIHDLPALYRCLDQKVSPCPLAAAVARWMPGESTAQRVLTLPAGMIDGASSALLHKGQIYIGAFGGNRVLKLAYPLRKR